MVKLNSAIFYYNKALSYFKKVNNEGKISTIYSNLGAAYNQSGKLDSALLFLKKVVVYKQKTNDSRNIPDGDEFRKLFEIFCRRNKK